MYVALVAPIMQTSLYLQSCLLYPEAKRLKDEHVSHVSWVVP